MTADEFKQWCDKYGLSKDQAAIVLGISRANAFKYANGSQPVSVLVSNQCELFDLLSKTKSLTVIQKRLAIVSQ